MIINPWFNAWGIVALIGALMFGVGLIGMKVCGP